MSIQRHANSFTIWLFKGRVSLSFGIWRDHYGHVPFAEIRNNGGRYAHEVLDVNWRVFWIVYGSLTLWGIGNFERVLRHWKRTA
jgi:hypothetical protein